MSGFFEAPAYKLTIADLLKANQLEGNESPWSLKLTSEGLKSKGASKGSSKLTLPHREITLTLNMVWIQGTVVQILPGEKNEDPPTLEVQDDTGSAFVFGYLALPGGDHPQIDAGCYIGVLGQIWSTDPDVVIKGSKIMCLVDKPLLEKVWEDEVKAAKALLLDILVPNLDT